MLDELLCLHLGLAILGGGLGATVAEAMMSGPLAACCLALLGAVAIAVAGGRAVLRFTPHAG